jgi:hypothetical protein
LRVQIVPPLLVLLFPYQGQSVKFFKDILPALGAGTTIAVNSQILVNGIKRTPRVLKAIPKGPRAVKEAVKGKK